MDQALVAFAGVVVGAVITGIVSVGGAWLKGRQEASLDREKRADNRRIDSDTFQRATLLELQERLQEWMTIRAQKANELTKMVEGGDTATFDALILADREVDTRLIYLTQRVLCDPLRTKLEALRALAGIADVGMSKHPAKVTAESIGRDWDRLSDLAVETQSDLGIELRKLL